ncbi:putative Cysteine dioxygenase [Sclerotinia borealis F-4128]|uniref:Cysteine dioxygenase n=1 Tax=Sclerotinia borealis (strain F-4128) TaxID=1432307 RepID=W9CT94_SCLBF|nr:putative Cysteine dioxygenase [Sclerotinia borealis F-4128]
MTPSIALDATGACSSSPPSTKSLSPPDNFHLLVADLSKTLGPSSGLTSADVDVQQLRSLMEHYISNEDEWRKYAFADLSRGYTRNLVDEGNGKSNLLILVWTPGKGSPLHDHANAHCLMKILSGSLSETQYTFPSTSTSTSPSTSPYRSQPESLSTPPSIIKSTTYTTNQVTYMTDDLGLHKISNPDPKKVAVSLHLYTPPNAAREGCNIFDETSGRKSHVTQSNFYSEFGKRVGGEL